MCGFIWGTKFLVTFYSSHRKLIHVATRKFKITCDSPLQLPLYIIRTALLCNLSVHSLARGILHHHSSAQVLSMATQVDKKKPTFCSAFKYIYATSYFPVFPVSSALHPQISYLSTNLPYLCCHKFSLSSCFFSFFQGTPSTLNAFYFHLCPSKSCLPFKIQFNSQFF